MENNGLMNDISTAKNDLNQPKKVEGLWDCPYCGQKQIGGLKKHCPACGHPQDADTRFYLPTQISYMDQEKADQYGKGADWDCPYCGSMNRYDATVCSNCGAPRDSSESNYFTRKKEETPVQVSEKKSSRKPLIAFLAILAALFALLLIIFIPRNNGAQITQKAWYRTIGVDALTTVQESDWSLPTGATLLSQQEEVRGYEQVFSGYQDVEVQRSREVIVGYEEVAPGYKDNGDGTFTEIQYTPAPVYDTEYYTETEKQPVYVTVPVMGVKYYYEIDRWLPARSSDSSGNDEEPYWADVQLAGNERESGRYSRYFLEITTDKNKTYTIEVDENTFGRYKTGDTCEITVSAGSITELDGVSVR